MFNVCPSHQPHQFRFWNCEDRAPSLNSFDCSHYGGLRKCLFLPVWGIPTLGDLGKLADKWTLWNCLLKINACVLQTKDPDLKLSFELQLQKQKQIVKPLYATLSIFCHSRALVCLPLCFLLPLYARANENTYHTACWCPLTYPPRSLGSNYHRGRCSSQQWS